MDKNHYNMVHIFDMDKTLFEIDIWENVGLSWFQSFDHTQLLSTYGISNIDKFGKFIVEQGDGKLPMEISTMIAERYGLVVKQRDELNLIIEDYVESVYENIKVDENAHKYIERLKSYGAKIAIATANIQRNLTMMLSVNAEFAKLVDMSVAIQTFDKSQHTSIIIKELNGTRDTTILYDDRESCYTYCENLVGGFINIKSMNDWININKSLPVPISRNTRLEPSSILMKTHGCKFVKTQGSLHGVKYNMNECTIISAGVANIMWLD